MPYSYKHKTAIGLLGTTNKPPLLAPDTPPDIPCFWVEGAESLEELVSMVENGEFDEVEEFDGDDDAWQEALGCGHHHEGHCGCSH